MPTVTPQQAFHLALQHHRCGRLAEAEALCRQILAIQPDHADALHLLGLIIHHAGQSELGANLIREAIRLFPNHPELHYNLGVVLQEAGRPGEAVTAFRSTLQFRPDDWKALTNLGNALMDLGRPAEAIASYHAALRIAPDEAKPHHNLGTALRETGLLDEAIAECHRALKLKPDYAEALNNLGASLNDQGRIGEALAAYRHAIQIKPDYAAAHSNLLLGLHCLPASDARAAFREHCRWDELHARRLANEIVPHGNDRNPGRKLRIGYVSPDFRHHPVATFIEGLLAGHDRSQVEVYCYADLLREDAFSARLRTYAETWRTITGMRDEQVAELIRRDEIDILVDLAGHTSGNRLLVFARKPAPVQVTYLGYCDTTGMRAMDYRLTDAFADPPCTSEHLHTEKLLRLPDSAWCFHPPAQPPPVEMPPSLRSNKITFGCFNARQKITAELLSTWSRLLLAVPGSRLLLKNLGLRDASVQRRMRDLLIQAGVAGERIELVGWVPTVEEHLATYHRVDIALDTFPYHGTTTTCEALWMGVPVITLAGRTHASRVGVSLLSNIGLHECIAENADDYIRIAAQLSHDLPRLTQLRATLRHRMEASVLMDATRFARHFEAACRQMWSAWCIANPA